MGAIEDLHKPENRSERFLIYDTFDMIQNGVSVPDVLRFVAGSHGNSRIRNTTVDFLIRRLMELFGVSEQEVITWASPF